MPTISQLKVDIFTLMELKSLNASKNILTEIPETIKKC